MSSRTVSDCMPKSFTVYSESICHIQYSEISLDFWRGT